MKKSDRQHLESGADVLCCVCNRPVTLSESWQPTPEGAVICAACADQAFASQPGATGWRTIRDMLGRYDISAATIRRWIANGRLSDTESEKLGGAWFVSPQAVAREIAASASRTGPGRPLSKMRKGEK